jgi:ABC-2 type transport system permease protein
MTTTHTRQPQPGGQQPAPRHHGSRVPTFARLLRTELHRLSARRFVRAAIILAIIGYAVMFVLLWTKHSRSDAADLRQATAQRDRQLAQFQADYADCIKQAPADQASLQCGDEPTTDGFDPSQYLKKHPLRPDQLDGIAEAIGVGTAALGFVIAATFVGAEWSTRNLVAWLFFEPRRLRLMLAKLLAVLSATLLIAVLAQLGFAVGARILLHHRGLPIGTLDPPDRHFWTHFAQVQTRAAVLVVATALLGFGLANLIRNTAAAFGISFLYFAVAESLLRNFRASWQPYLFTDNVGAWISHGGITVSGDLRYDPSINTYINKQIHVSNLHGGIALLIYAGVITIISTWLFRRRDIS